MKFAVTWRRREPFLFAEIMGVKPRPLYGREAGLQFLLIQ